MNLTELSTLSVESPFTSGWFDKTLSVFHQEISRSQNALREYAEYLSRELLGSLWYEVSCRIQIEATGVGQVASLKINDVTVFAPGAEGFVITRLATDETGAHRELQDDQTALVNQAVDAYCKLQQGFARGGLTSDSFSCSFFNGRPSPNIRIV